MSARRLAPTALVVAPVPVMCCPVCRSGVVFDRTIFWFAYVGAFSDVEVYGTEVTE